MKRFGTGIRDALIAALQQGWTVKDASSSLAWGITVGLNPIYGTTTISCALIGWLGRLNHTLLQVGNYAVGFIKPFLVIPFIRLGEAVFQPAQRFTLSLTEFGVRFQNDPLATLGAFGATFLHAIVAWLLIAPVVWFICRVVTQMLLTRVVAFRPAPEPAEVGG